MVLVDGGRKGLELVRREYPDVVVLDLKMPEMDGLTILQEIRRIKSSSRQVVLTGPGTPELERQVHVLGMTETPISVP